jgi:hypothetical protein
MNKTKLLLITSTCALTINNSFGMLTKISSPLKMSHKTRYCSKISLQDKAKIQETIESQNGFNHFDDSFKISTNGTCDNQKLLLKIIQQNEENNALLKENNDLQRAVLKQNDLHAYLAHNYFFDVPNVEYYIKLNHLRQNLKKKYNLQVDAGAKDFE